MTRFCSKLAAFVFLAAPLAAQSEAGLWRFLHPNAKALISIDWRRVGHSHVGTMLRDKWVSGSPAGSFPGIEFLDDIDRFIISSSGRSLDSDTPDAPVLIVVGGRFDLAKVRKVLAAHGAKPQAFNTFQVYRPQGKNAKDLAFVLFDAQTILIGDSRSIFATLERNAFPPPPPEPKSILARAAEMEASYEAWALITTPDALASDRITSLLSGGELGAEAQGFEAGFSMRNGLAADITVMFQNEASAKKMATELSRIVKLTVKDKLGEPALLDMEKKFKFSSEGTQVKVSLRLTPQELEKNAKIYASTRKPTAASVPEIRPVVTIAQPPPPPEKRVIRIEGLDGGPREIPYKQQ